jgi:trans-aconitate methyltransferase
MNKQQIKQLIIDITELKLTDKASYHSYEFIYPELLEPYSNGIPLNILEIGTGYGGGLLILSKIFPESTVYGLDHNYDILTIPLNNTNIILLEAMDQTDPSSLKEIEGIDIVIEDASHDYIKSIQTFEMIKPKLNKNALYIIEDVYPQYLDNYKNDSRFEIVDLSQIKNRADDIIAIYRNN